MKISLVLGSGGARGYAHIGVIEVLEEMGLEIASISGSSMGALIGGLFAAGKLQEYKEWVLGLDVWDVAKLLDISFDRRGLIKGERVFERLKDILGEVKIEDLPIKFTAVATDLSHAKEIWFQKGDLLQSMRASISIPSFFTPVEMNGMLLVDGGVLNPLPVAPTMSDETDRIIAVSLYAKSPKPEIVVPKDVFYKERRISQKASQILGDFRKKISKKEGYDLFDIVDNSYDTMQYQLIRYRLAGYPPDDLIEISKDVCGTYDFHRAYEVIEAGREAALEYLQFRFPSEDN